MRGVLDFLKEYLPLKEAMHGDLYAIWLNIIGGCLIGITFCAIGIMCLFHSKKVPVEPAHKQRRILSQLIGSFLFTCGVARFVDVYCIWHHIAVLNGWIKILTGIISLITVAYVPAVLKAMRNSADIKSVQQTLNQVNKKVEEVRKTINEKLSNTGE